MNFEYQRVVFKQDISIIINNNNNNNNNNNRHKNMSQSLRFRKMSLEFVYCFVPVMF